MDSYYVIAICIIVALASLTWGVVVHQRSVRLERIIRALLTSQEQVLLFYDEKDRLAFDTCGLILFDRGAKRSIRKLKQKPLPGRESRGEIEIDGNRYRFRSKLLEFKPETFGTVLYLEYQGPLSAKK